MITPGGFVQGDGADLDGGRRGVASADARFRFTRELIYQERLLRDHLISSFAAKKTKKALWRDLEEQLVKRIYEKAP